MKKRLLSLGLALVLCLGLLPVTALAADSDFVIKDGVLTNYTGPGGDVVIPDGVTKIGGNTGWFYHGAFERRSDVTSVTIPDSVTEIDFEAFVGCSGLTSVTIPGSVTSIGKRAFQGCKGLESVTIGSGVTEIGEDAFGDCSSLTDVELPNTLTTIAGGAFWGCTSLTSVTIPSSVDSIGYRAFYNCVSLGSVTIPSSVTNIGEEAFAGTLWEAGPGGFDFDIENGVLTNYNGSGGDVVIPDAATSIGESAFYWRTNLTSVTIPPSVTSIGEDAFELCTSLKSVTIPNSVTSIGEEAFRNCTRLTSVTIPGSVTSIGDYAFLDCTSLTSVTIQSGVTSIGNSMFNGCTSLTSMTIPFGVTSIGNSAFYECKSLTSVTIPDSVTSIGDRAFYWCGSLTSVTIPASVTSIADDAFDKYSMITIRGAQGSYAETYAKNQGITFVAIDSVAPPQQPDQSELPAWAAGTVSAAIAQGLVPQELQGSYNLVTTRAQFCALAVKLYESVKGEITGRETFTDTNDVNVQKMASLGVVGGVGNGVFNPDVPLTREQAATILTRLADAMGKPFPSGPHPFTDGVATWADAAVGQAYQAGIMNGTGDTTFAPKGEYTRMQSIVTIMRLYDLVK